MNLEFWANLSPLMAMVNVLTILATLVAGSIRDRHEDDRDSVAAFNRGHNDNVLRACFWTLISALALSVVQQLYVAG